MPQYTRQPPLDESALDADPMAQLASWLKDAEGAGMIEPTAMTLATATKDGSPSARIVLYKGPHEGGLTFYTSYESRKGGELAANARAALVFWWDKLERSVRVEGRVEKLPRAMGEAYARSRPRGSQLSALTSRQSRTIASRAELEKRLADNDARIGKKEVPVPENWGGYVLRPQTFEFWQGRRDRLHDRLVYRASGDGWRIERVEP
ncbi:MAG: pyridoxamine 5'-phosphate oxidase [Gammaproteobacteria bacterium]